MADRADGHATGMAGEFFVMERLFRLGVFPALTLGNAKSVDILVRSKTGQNLAVSVKAVRGNAGKWTVGAEDYSEQTDLIFVFLLYKNFDDLETSPRAWVVPAVDVQAIKQPWLNKGPALSIPRSSSPGLLRCFSHRMMAAITRVRGVKIRRRFPRLGGQNCTPVSTPVVNYRLPSSVVLMSDISSTLFPPGVIPVPVHYKGVLETYALVDEKDYERLIARGMVIPWFINKSQRSRVKTKLSTNGQIAPVDILIMRPRAKERVVNKDGDHTNLTRANLMIVPRSISASRDGQDTPHRQ
jgi:hypothetical protein